MTRLVALLASFVAAAALLSSCAPPPAPAPPAQQPGPLTLAVSTNGSGKPAPQTITFTAHGAAGAVVAWHINGSNQGTGHQITRTFANPGVVTYEAVATRGSLSVTAGSWVTVTASESFLAQVSDRVLARIDAQRAANDVPALQHSTALSEGASDWSQTIRAMGVGLDQTWADDDSGLWGNRSEAVLRHGANGTADQVAARFVNAWMASVGTRSKLLDPAATHVGVGLSSAEVPHGNAPNSVDGWASVRFASVG